MENIPVFANDWSKRKLEELVEKNSEKVDLKTLLRIGLTVAENPGLFNETDSEVMNEVLNTPDKYDIYPLTVAAAETGPDLRNSKNYDDRTVHMRETFQQILEKTIVLEAFK